jgi:hypothetical protein
MRAALVITFVAFSGLIAWVFTIPHLPKRHDLTSALSLSKADALQEEGYG